MPASAQQVLKVGSTPTGIPFTFLDTKTNSIQGIMVDLITEIGKDAGFQVQIEPMQFSALVPSLTSNKIDIISAAMFATAARKEVIDFSDAVYTYGEGLRGAEDRRQELRFAGRPQGRDRRRPGRNGLRRCAEEDGIVQRGQGLRHHSRHPARRERRPPQGRLRRLSDPRLQSQAGRFRRGASGRLPTSPSPSARSRIGVRKSDTELLAKINASLAKLKANGTIDKILEKWGLKADAS